jgi:hypothetical protein
MFAYPPQPRRRRPPFDGRELYVHAHRSCLGITPDERELVIVFLTRYVVWCAQARRIERLRNTLGLLVEVTAN